MDVKVYTDGLSVNSSSQDDQNFTLLHQVTFNVVLPSVLSRFMWFSEFTALNLASKETRQCYSHYLLHMIFRGFKPAEYKP